MDLATFVAVRLAKEGFGPADAILRQPTDLVMAQLEYSNFNADYERTFVELRKNENR